MIPQLVTRPLDRHRARGHRRACPRGTGSISRTFDLPRSRPATVTNSDGSTTGTTYDAAGQVTDTTDELGRITNVDYDAAGRRTATTDANGHATTFAYDATDVPSL